MGTETPKQEEVDEVAMNKLGRSVGACKGHVTRVVKSMDRFDHTVGKETEFKDLLERFNKRFVAISLPELSQLCRFVLIVYIR